MASKTKPVIEVDDLSDIVVSLKKTIKDSRLKKAIQAGNDMQNLTDNEEEYIVLPKELKFEEFTGMKGLPFGKIVQIAGRSDSGKTSFAIKAMKAAQEQGHGIIYVETENKTSKRDIESWGVDPKGVIVIESCIVEEAFALLFKAWDAFYAARPDKKVLIVFDSLGNMTSLRDGDLDMLSEKQMPGGKGKANKLGMGKLVVKMRQDPAAVLAISYTYANIGSVGDVVAGGGGIALHGFLTLHSKRIGWVYGVKKGVRLRIGAKVRYLKHKSHVKTEEPLPQAIEYTITKDGFTFVSWGK